MRNVCTNSQSRLTIAGATRTIQDMREWRSGNVGAFQAHVESSILSSRTSSYVCVQ